MLNIKVHDRTIRKRLNKYGMFARVSRSKSLVYKKNMVAWVRFRKLQDFWNSV